eukprot:5004274-Amphidinium_carterae.1
MSTVLRLPFLWDVHGLSQKAAYYGTRGHPIQHWIYRHDTLQGHLLRHRPGFAVLLETADPTEMWLGHQTLQPRFQLQSRPRRWNGLYINISISLGYHNYWRMA